MEFPSCLHLAKGHLHNCSVPSSWANLQSCAWERWNTKPLKQKLKLSVASFIFSVLCKHTCECFACLNQVYCAWNYASNWKSNMLKSIYNTAQSYSISTSRQEPFPTTLRVCQIFCPSKTLKAAHYLSTALQLRTAPNISFPQPSLLLKEYCSLQGGRNRTRPGYFFSRSEQPFVHCTFTEATGEGKPQVLPALEETKQLNHLAPL